MFNRWHIDSPTQGSSVISIIDDNEKVVCDLYSMTEAHQKEFAKNAVLISRTPEMYRLIRLLQSFGTLLHIFLRNDEIKLLNDIIDEVENNS